MFFKKKDRAFADLSYEEQSQVFFTRMLFYSHNDLHTQMCGLAVSLLQTAITIEEVIDTVDILERDDLERSLFNCEQRVEHLERLTNPMSTIVWIDDQPFVDWAADGPVYDPTEQTAACFADIRTHLQTLIKEIPRHFPRP